MFYLHYAKIKIPVLHRGESCWLLQLEMILKNSFIMVQLNKLEFGGTIFYMSIKLIKGSCEYKTQIIDMLEEWTDYNRKNETNRSPWVIFKNNYDDFDYYLNNLETSEPKDGLVPDSTFFCLDEERNIIVGAVNIRHYLNEYLLAHGGHIGDGIRPSERRKGYATQMVGLALEECKKIGIKKVLMICDKDNIGSAKSIIKNGGILENERMENGRIEQRYWIDLA